MVKVMSDPESRAKCPHYDQVRPVNFYYINAKGPIYARSMIRKVLGNEEFCLQIDAHTRFTKDWDEKVVNEWKLANNEFGVLTNVPAPLTEKSDYDVGGAKEKRVPRQCAVRFGDNGYPDYMAPADGYVEQLSRPLLSHGYSAAFSFAKCHFEESVPYDPFLTFAKPIEQFSRYARLFTRGYDTYTPTQNIVFHDYEEQSNGHGKNEWFKRQRDRFRKGSITRVKTMLQLPGGVTGDEAQANLGIYGLGQRRTVEQLAAFTNIDVDHSKGNVPQHSLMCSGKEWVPYDANISPVANLYNKPDDLDPQPVFPLRTKLEYYEQVIEALPDVQIALDEVDTSKHTTSVKTATVPPVATTNSTNQLPILLLLLVLWCVGLFAWCSTFVLRGSLSKRPRKKKGGDEEEIDFEAAKDV